MSRLLVPGLLLALGLAAPARAQTGYVRVDAPSGEAVVAVGGRVAGRAGDVLAVPADSATTVALVEDGPAWSPRRAEVTVSVPAGDTLAVGLALPERYRVETLPLRAAVALARPDGTSETLGEAPLTVDLPAGTDGAFVATLDGYAEARLALDGRPGGPLVLVLTPEGATPGAAPVTVLTTERSGRGRPLVDAAVGALTLVAGAAAVFTKFRADRLDDRYRDPASAERGSEVLRSEALRLDRYSLAALGAMQVGVGFLAVRLVLR